MENASPTVEPSSLRADVAWDEAFLRVEGYLRSYGLESHVVLNQITYSIIAEAQACAHDANAPDPVALAMEVTHSRIGAWFARSGHPIDWSDGRSRAQSRLALIIADAPGRWANSFLSQDPLPEELVAAMASFQMLPAPDIRQSGMAPEPLEFGLLEPGDPRLRSKRIWIPMRVAVPWLLIFGFFGVAWASSH
jgi:hypothetical protein